MPPLITTILSKGIGRAERNSLNRAFPAGTVPSGFSFDPPAVHVYIETATGSGIFQLAERVDWESVARGMDGTETKAALIVRALDADKLDAAASIGAEHLSQLLDQLHPDRRVRVAMPRGADPPIILFQGYALSRTASWSERHQAITLAAIAEGEERLASDPQCQISGRLMRKYPFRDPATVQSDDLVEVDALPPVFNAEGKPNRLDYALTFPRTEGKSGTHRIFAFTADGDPRAKFWNAADALRYVAYHYAVKAGVSVDDFLLDTDAYVGLEGGSPDDPFARRNVQRIEHAAVASMNAREAIAALCRGAGLHFEIAVRNKPESNDPEYFLRVFAEIVTLAEETATRERMMAAPRALDIPRDRPFSNYQGLTAWDIALRNEARQSQLAIDDRAINAPVFLAGARDWECSLLLRPGWKPDPNLDDMLSDGQAQAAKTFWEEQFAEEEDDDSGEIVLSVYDTRHPEHHRYADVGRLWVFPDTLEYMDVDPETGFSSVENSPFARNTGPWASPQFYSPYLFEGTIDKLIYVDGEIGGDIPVSEVADWVLHRRPFGELIARINPSTTERTPRMEINFTAVDPFTALADPNWIPFTGTPVLDKERAALWIKEDNLWKSAKLRPPGEDEENNYLSAYLGIDFETGEFRAPHLFVRITCTVRGDRRLRYAPAPSSAVLQRARARVIDLGFEQFVLCSRRGQNSALNAMPVDPDPNYETREDTVELHDFADRARALMDAVKVAGSWEAPYIKTDERIGDSFRGVSGLGIDFRSWPTCVSIEWMKDPRAGYRTVMHLTDLRHAPEEGAE